MKQGLPLNALIRSSEFELQGSRFKVQGSRLKVQLFFLTFSLELSACVLLIPSVGEGFTVTPEDAGGVINPPEPQPSVKMVAYQPSSPNPRFPNASLTRLSAAADSGGVATPAAEEAQHPPLTPAEQPP